MTPAGRSGREAASAASRPTPMTLVAGAVAGEDLASVAATTAAALAQPVAIAIPALGSPVVCPPGGVDPAVAQTITAHARAVARGESPAPPPAISEAVPIRIADEVVGIVAAVETAPGKGRGNGPPRAERRAWLEAAAAAASVTALIREAHTPPGTGGPGAELVAELAAGAPEDLAGVLSRARRLGIELGNGAIALCARRAPGADVPPLNGELRGLAPTLVAPRGEGRLLALVPLAADAGFEAAETFAARLTDAGWTVAASTARRDPALLHQALVEAELLAELREGAAAPVGQDETFRLLIGVLLRDREELQALRSDTIAALADYDARHDTDLLATLRAFLAHDGSTTETAEAMALHRHTVGYRLSRVHEVSGLSPYESDGRERLSLGIKAAQILEAERRRGLSPPR
jgi:hypothetical protein